MTDLYPRLRNAIESLTDLEAAAFGAATVEGFEATVRDGAPTTLRNVFQVLMEVAREEVKRRQREIADLERAVGRGCDPVREIQWSHPDGGSPSAAAGNITASGDEPEQDAPGDEPV